MPLQSDSRTLDVAPATHTVRAYDRELARLRGLIQEMGERTVEQLQGAIAALLEPDPGAAYRVLDREPQVDYLALDADEELFRLIARRQPAAVDLRMILALGRVAAEAERAADKAAGIASRALALRADGPNLPASIHDALQAQDALACCAFERSITAVAHFDLDLAIGILEQEGPMRDQAQAVHAALIARREPPLGPAQLGPLFVVAHALEQIGKHACSIAEQVIYVAEGHDVRFRNREILIETLRHRGEPPGDQVAIPGP